MKKIILIIGIVFLSNLVFSQKISSLSPTMIVWQQNKNKVSLSQARYGVAIQDSLSLDVYFSQSTFDRITNSENVQFEFRWYYYLTTRRSLMYTEKIDFSNIQISNNGVVIIHSSQNKLQSGWWEVQVLTTYDNGYLEIANTSKFQVLIK